MTKPNKETSSSKATGFRGIIKDVIIKDNKDWVYVIDDNGDKWRTCDDGKMYRGEDARGDEYYGDYDYEDSIDISWYVRLPDGTIMDVDDTGLLDMTQGGKDPSAYPAKPIKPNPNP